MREPGARETAALGLTTMVITAIVVSGLGGFWSRVPSFGDNGPFIQTAEHITRGSIAELVPQHLWGYPYLGAALSLLTPLDASASLLVVCWVSAVVALLLTRKLWGGWVACFFAVTSIEWIQHATLGGAQSLAMALTYGSFLLARQERWYLAALLAAICTVVRPEGAIALIALGLVLLWRRRFRTLAGCVAIGVVIGVLYATPLYLAFGDPFANYRNYQKVAFPESLLSWPLTAMIGAAVSSAAPMSHKLMMAFWIAVIVVGLAAMVITPHFRRYARAHPYEALYVALVTAFYFSYNSIHAFHQFARFTLSLVPLAYFALLPWLPKDRRILWTAGVVTSVFAGMSAMNVRRSLSILRRRVAQ